MVGWERRVSTRNFTFPDTAYRLLSEARLASSIQILIPVNFRFQLPPCFRVTDSRSLLISSNLLFRTSPPPLPKPVLVPWYRRKSFLFLLCAISAVKSTEFRRFVDGFCTIPHHPRHNCNESVLRLWIIVSYRHYQKIVKQRPLSPPCNFIRVSQHYSPRITLFSNNLHKKCATRRTKKIQNLKTNVLA